MQIILKDKREITLDLYVVTVSDIRSLLDGKKDKAEPFSKEDEIIAKTVSLTVDELRALPFPDYRKIIKAFWDCVRDPLKDEGEEKNSVSVSTTD